MTHNVFQQDDIDETIRVWKANSLILRFWINIMKNPCFFLDVSLHDLVDSSMTVIASTLMECCSTGNTQVGDQDPINKQLFNKTIMQFRAKVIPFYNKVKESPKVTQQQVVEYIQKEIYQKNGKPEIYPYEALEQMLHYFKKYQQQIVSRLDDELGDTPEVSELTQELEYFCFCNS
jgi:plexin B